MTPTLTTEYSDPLSWSVYIEERPETQGLIYVHHGGGRGSATTQGELSGGQQREGKFLATLRAAGHVLTESPVLRTIEEEVAVVGKNRASLRQKGGVARGQTEGQRANVHRLCGEYLSREGDR